MPRVELKITLDESGQVHVTGPLGNLILCYGMMDMAKDAIRAQAARQIQRPTPADVVAIGQGVNGGGG